MTDMAQQAIELRRQSAGDGAEPATGRQASARPRRRFEAYLSSNRTCEIGLQEATGAPYVSVVQLLEEVTRA